MADNFLEKSFLFEIVDIATQKIEKSFTLVLPPQSYSIRERARVNITKTFGNAFIDDYGADNIEMTIKGISGTAHAFPTFNTKGTSFGDLTTIQDARSSLNALTPSTGYRHKEAFYTFRDDIMRYRDRPDFDKKELRVYDLGDEQAYKCILMEFTVERTAATPFHYPFTISLFVYQKLGTKGFVAKPIEISTDPNLAMANMLSAANSLDERFKIFRNIQDIRNKIANFTNLISLLEAKFNTWLVEARTVVESPLLITKQLIDAGIVLSKAFYDAFQQGKIAYVSWVNAAETVKLQIRQALGIYGFAIQQGAQKGKETIFEQYNGMDFTNPSSPIVLSSQRSLAFYGVILYTVRGGDTLEIIAQRQMGDESLWPYIAAINSTIRTSADLVVGEEIYIPVQQLSGQINKDSFIMTEDSLRDPYGADIQIDVNGNMVLLESNDVSTVSGLSNIIQAINTRFFTEVGSMIKQTAFGILTKPGMAGTSYAIKYFKMAMINSIMQDSRIEQISNVRVALIKDAFYISMDVTLVGRENSLPVSVVK